MSFNDPIERRGTHSSKWDMMEKLYDVPQQDGIAMWTADSDYATAPCVIDALRRAADHGVFGYMPIHDDYLNAIQWWMKTRHNWDIDTSWALTSQGLGNAIALCLDLWTDPGARVVIFTPVYHEFQIKIEKAGREAVTCPLKHTGDSYVLDLEDAQSRLDGSEQMLIWCSPQNPSGRVWTTDELRGIAEFAARNDLILVSDEIHHDLVFPDHTFVPMHIAAPEVEDRLIVLTAASKTFNIAGQRTGNMIIPDAKLRKEMQHRLNTLDYKPAALSLQMITAAYSPEGAKWADAQIQHLDQNRKTFDAAIATIPGVTSMPLQATYLAWVDFSGTGMSYDEISQRVRKSARIAPSAGPDFGPGGETFLRFNLATQHHRVEEACARLKDAFSDLQ
ncbi:MULTISPECIES: MalY/PatB family protein [Roseobacter]|uniref:MalY/PatB family protein n=1 Tax=Roseobacter TaxID=2433 RepID=UPI001BB95959|nr:MULTISPECIES: PatB family C-S lyase [Roseobacter]GIT88405.1 aminotransferase [Roseobacter sp. OBYS 0001]